MRLLRDGEEVFAGTEQEVWAYIHRYHSYSVDHALKYEGYSIEDDDPTPYCNACGARTKRECDCPPIPEND